MADEGAIDQSISVGRDAVNSIITSGNGNTVIVYQMAAVVATPTQATGANPYLGLLAFTEADAGRFFGREKLVEQLWERFRDLNAAPAEGTVHRLLTIMGPSGSGKSSVARAGLLAELARRPLPGRDGQRVAILTPGEHPLEALAAVLARIATQDPAPVAKTREFADELERAGTDGLHDGLRRIAGALPDMPRQPLVVLVDQFEEIYSLCTSEPHRNIFVETLLDAARDRGGGLSVILTMRSDFLGATQANNALNQIIARQSVIVPSMSAIELRSAIAEPARRAGRPLDEDTIKRLVDETEGRDGALPLLQFVLVRAWEGMIKGRTAGSTVDELGGVGGALGAEAERLYLDLSPPDQLIAQRAFLAMVSFNENLRPTRHRALVSQLVADDEAAPDDEELEAVRRVVDRFAQPGSRLVTLAGGAGGAQTVEVTHEAIFQHWDRLKQWLIDGLDDIRLHLRVAQAAELWDAGGRPEGSLWRPPDLDLLRALAAKPTTGLTTAERGFYREAVAAHDREITGRRRREWLVRGAAAVFLLLALGAYWEKTQADDAISTASDATNNISHTLVERLNDVEGTQDIRRDLHDVVKNVEALLTPGGGPNATRGVFWDHIIEGRVAKERHEITVQAKEFVAALALARKNVARRPSNLEWQRNLVVALEDSGGLPGAPDRKAALTEAVRINRGLIAKASGARRYDADIPQYRHDLMGSLALLGQINDEAGDYDEEERNFKEALEIVRALMKDNPENRTYKFEAANYYSALGRLQRTRGNYDAAYERTTQAKIILSDPTKGERNNPRWTAALAQVGSELVETQLDKYYQRADPADLAAARTEADAAMQIASPFADAHPENVGWQLLVINLEKQRADIELKAGRLPAARQYATAAIEKAIGLQKIADPAEWRSPLAWSQHLLAQVETSACNLSAARQASERALGLTRALAKVPTPGDGPKFDLFSMLETRTEIERRDRAHAAAATAIREAVQTATELRTRFPEDSGLLRDFQRLGGIERDVVARIPLAPLPGC